MSVRYYIDNISLVIAFLTSYSLAGQDFLHLDYQKNHTEIISVHPTERGIYYLRMTGFSTDLVHMNNKKEMDVLYSSIWSTFRADFHPDGDKMVIYLSDFFDFDVGLRGYIRIDHIGDTVLIDDSRVYDSKSRNYKLMFTLPNDQILGADYNYFYLLNNSGVHLDTINDPFARFKGFVDFEDEYFFNQGKDPQIWRFDSSFSLVQTVESNVQDLKRLSNNTYAVMLSGKIQIYDEALDRRLEEITIPEGFEFLQDIAFLDDCYFIGLKEGDSSALYSYKGDVGWLKVYTYPCPNMQNRFILNDGEELILIGSQDFDNPMAIIQTLIPFQEPVYNSIDISLANASMILVDREIMYYDSSVTFYYSYNYDIQFSVTNNGESTIENFTLYSDTYAGYNWGAHIVCHDSIPLAPGDTRVIECSYTSSHDPILGDLRLYIPGGNGTINNNCSDNITTTSIVTSNKSAIVGSHKLKVYPNPVRQKLFIDNPYSSRGELILSNLQGNIIYLSQIDDMVSFDVTGLSPGIYFAQLTHQKGRHLEKVIVNR